MLQGEQSLELRGVGEGAGDAAVRFFETARATFHTAAGAAGGVADYFFTIAGATVRVRFAGSAMLGQVEPALEHLRAAPDPTPALTIYVWDSESTGVTMPPPPWGRDDYQRRGEIQGYNTRRIFTTYRIEGEALSIFDAATNEALYWAPDAAKADSEQRAAPLRAILHWWSSQSGGQLTHAGAVGTADGAVLLTGRGGSGKSTTALACLRAGLLYVGDDFVRIDLLPRPFVHSLYNSAKLAPRSLELLPELAHDVAEPVGPEQEKAILYLRQRYPRGVVGGLPLRAIVVPRVTGGAATRLRRISGALSLAALAPSTLFLLPNAGEQAFQTLAALTQQIPSFALELGTDVAAIPGVLSRLLAEV